MAIYKRRIAKTKIAIEKAEVKMKVLDKKMEILKNEVYDNVLPLKALQRKNQRLTEFLENVDFEAIDLCASPDLFSSQKDALIQNNFFVKIIKVLKDEVYTKPAVIMDDETLLEYIILSEKAIYSQWILQTLVKKIKKTENEKYKFDSSYEALFYLQKLLDCCNMSTREDSSTNFSALLSTSYKILTDTEQDLLIFMHLSAQMQFSIESMKGISFNSEDRSQILTSKVEKCESQKKYLKALLKFKCFEENLQNIDLSKVIRAISGSKDIERKNTEIAVAFEAYKNYIIQVSGQVNKILESVQVDADKVNGSCNELAVKIDYYIDQGVKNISENFHLKILREKFSRETRNYMKELRSLIMKMKELTIMDVGETRNRLQYLKTLVDVVLKSKWKFQKHLSSLGGTHGETLTLSAGTNFILENVEDTLFHLRILDQMESNKHFHVMSSLFELQERRELLTNKFRNVVSRIRHQKMGHTPTIKSILLKLNQEIQVLFSDYQKLRLHFHFLVGDKRRELKSTFKDIETTVMADIKTIKDKRFVGFPKLKNLNKIESEVVQTKTEDSIEDVMKAVDETMGFLQSLDEIFISQEFAVMRYLSKLHCSKEQILSSFKNLLDSMFKLSNEDEEQILNRLKLIKDVTDDLIQKYEVVGMKMLLFSDIMTMLDKEVETSNFKDVFEDGKINIYEIFKSTEGFENINYQYDKRCPSKAYLFDLLKDKEKVVEDFENFVDRMPDLGIHNTLDAMHSVVRLIIKAEDVLRQYQRLRMRLIWMTDGDMFNIKREKL